jgi:hypothetical protein
VASPSPSFTPVIVNSRGDIAGFLADLRRAAGMTGEELDYRAGFSDRYTAKLEQGDKPYGRKGFVVEPGKIKVWGMGEVWLEALGARLVIVPAAVAEAIGAVAATKREPVAVQTP